MERIKKLLLVTTRDLRNIGGVERYLNNFIRHYKQPDVELGLLLRRYKKDGATDYGGIPVQYFETAIHPYKNFLRFLNPLNVVKELKHDMAAHLKDVHPDAILTRNWDVVLAATGILKDTPVYFMPGSLLKMDLMFDRAFEGSLVYRISRWLQNGVKVWLERSAFRACTHVLVFSKNFKERIQEHYGIPSGNISIIPIGIELPDKNPDAIMKKGTILCVGRLAPSKNFLTAIEAMRGLEGFHLLIAGDGPQRKELEDKIRGLNLENQITLLGNQNDLSGYYQQCEIFLHLSYYENLGQVLLEAMLYGKPPIVLDPKERGVHTASAELIQEGYNGFFVTNTPEAVRTKIREVAKLDKEPLAENCRQFARQFTFDRHVRELIGVVEKKGKTMSNDSFTMPDPNVSSYIDKKQSTAGKGELHLAIVCWKYWPSAGIPNHVRSLVEQLKGKAKIAVFAVDVNAQDSVNCLTFYPVQKGRNIIFKIFYYFKALNQVAKTIKFNVIHCHDSETFFSCYLLKYFLKIPIIFTLHASIFEPGRESDYPWHTTIKYRLTEGFSLRSSDRVIAISQSMARYAREGGASPQKIDVIPGSISRKTFIKSTIRNLKKTKKSTGLYVGGLRPVKGIKYLIEAIPSIHKQIPDFKLILVGNGEQQYTDGLTQLVKQRGLNDHVIFAGYQKKEALNEYFQKADIFVLPSLSEPQGLVVLEAMAAGLPIVATNVGGIPDMIEHKKNGYLVEKKNAGALAEGILAVLLDSHLYTALSTNAIDSWNSFPNYSEKIEASYRTVAWRGHGC